jgi:translocation and assembly module TamB
MPARSSWSLDVAIRDLAVADDGGVWLNVDQAKLDWEPGALFRREFRIDGLDLDRMTLERLPETPPGDEPFSLPRLPDLPVGLDLQRLSVGKLDLGPPVLGDEAASLTIEGSAKLGRAGEGVAANLRIDRLDKPSGVKLAMDYAPATGRLDLDLTMEEPAGGVIARAAGIPGLPPVNVALRGSGPLSGWNGRLDGTAGDIARIRVDANIRGIQTAEGGQGYGMTIRGDAAFSPMLDPQTAGIVGDSVEFRAEAAIDPHRRIALTPARVTMAAGTLSLSGAYRLDPQELEFDYVVEAGPDSSLRALVPGLSWETIRLSGKVAGPLDQASSTIAVALNGGLTDQAMASDPRLAQVAGPEVKIAGNAVITPGTGEIRIDDLRADASAGTITATALIREWGRTVDAQAGLDVPDLSRLAGVAGAPLEGAARLNADLSGGNQATLMQADLSGDVTNLRTGTSPADALLGRKVDMAGLVTVGSDGSIDLSNLKIDGQHVTLTASGALKDNILDAKWRASLPRLTVLAGPLNAPMVGSAALDGTASGPLDALEVRADLAGRDLLLSGRSVPRADLALRATHLPGSPRGTLTAQALVDKQPIDARTAFALEGERLNLTDISLGAERNRITGAIRVALDRMTASGKLGGDMRDLGVFSALAGQTLGGSGRLNVKLDDPRGQQAATATVRGRNISEDDGDIGRFRVSLAVSGQEDDPDGVVTAPWLCRGVVEQRIAALRDQQTDQGRQGQHRLDALGGQGIGSDGIRHDGSGLR